MNGLESRAAFKRGQAVRLNFFEAELAAHGLLPKAEGTVVDVHPMNIGEEMGPLYAFSVEFNLRDGQKHVECFWADALISA